jgi:hypothetical protein
LLTCHDDSYCRERQLLQHVMNAMLLQLRLQPPIAADWSAVKATLLKSSLLTSSLTDITSSWHRYSS